MDNPIHRERMDKIERVKKYLSLIPSLLFVILLTSFMIPIIERNFSEIAKAPLPKKEFISVVRVNETISQGLVDRIEGNIERTVNDKKLAGFMFVFNSPGGDPSASQNLMALLKDLKTKFPVFGYINTACTSGCYYGAVGLDKISINKNAMVGSVGVLMQLVDASELSKKIGINEKTITLGEYKKPFSTINGINPKNQAYIKEQMLRPVYENFIEDVISERGIEGNREDIIQKYFEGQVFVGNDKRIQGVLVDEVIDYYSYKNQILNSLGRTKLDINFVEAEQSSSLDFIGKIKRAIGVKSEQNYSML